VKKLGILTPSKQGLNNVPLIKKKKNVIASEEIFFSSQITNIMKTYLIRSIKLTTEKTIVATHEEGTVV
jgi:hypothetical protein